MKRSRKKNVNVAIAAFIALMIGITVWSCSQDDIEDHCPRFYRYSSEEISTLRSIAEDYGVPDIRFITESPYPLPSMQEMETTFAEFAAIKQILARPLEVTDSAGGIKTLETKPISFIRTKQSQPETSSESIDLSRMIYAFGQHLNLTLTVSVTTDKKKPNSAPKISVCGNLELPNGTSNITYKKKDEKTSYSLNGSNIISISYSCTVQKYQRHTIQDFPKDDNDYTLIVLAEEPVKVETTTSF